MKLYGHPMSTYLTYVEAAKHGDVFDAPNVSAWWKRISSRDSWKTATGG